MTIADMISQSSMLTLLGMGVVFSFLIIMIISMYALHAVLHAVGADKESPDTSKAAGNNVAASPSAAVADTQAVVAAIAAAIHAK